jgi:transposase
VRGHLTMSKKERECLGVFERVKKGLMKLKEAAEILGKSYRQVRRKYKRYAEQGDEGLVHRGRGRKSNRKYGEKKKKEIIKRYRARYQGFGPTLAAEKLKKEGHEIDHETLRRWLLEEGLWERRRKRGKHRSWRKRRAHFGELVQMDGSPHDWFEGRREGCCLMNMVDDASGVTLANFEEEETTAGAMKLLWKWIEKYGLPMALYTDRKNVYVPEEKAAEKAKLRGEECLTQFGRACKELGIRIIEAHSPQAKGRVERSNGTYQDRLVKELRLERVKDIEEANRLLHGGFIDDLNTKFSVEPREEADYHRDARGYDLNAIFCVEEKRSLTKDWIVRFENNYYQINRKTSVPPAVKRVKVRRYLNDELHINYRGKDVEFTQLPERPVPPVKPARAVRVCRKTKSNIPPSDHPWRRKISHDVEKRRRGSSRSQHSPKTAGRTFTKRD